MKWCGLSPRVRGNLRRGRGGVPCPGTIPACTGEPPCGSIPCVGFGGLSPRVRGNRLEAGQGTGRTRTIPACTGEPQCSPGVTVSARDYPRVYGGTREVARLLLPLEGLSPRVRGNLLRQAQGGRMSGTIPACTGEPDLGIEYGVLMGDYPRVYGGTWIKVREGRLVMGLSPRVRGNPVLWGGAGRRPGTIPACTGEPARDAEACCHARGLSPRVRGNRSPSTGVRNAVGTIPACTGEPGKAQW